MNETYLNVMLTQSLLVLQKKGDTMTEEEVEVMRAKQ